VVPLCADKPSSFFSFLTCSFHSFLFCVLMDSAVLSSSEGFFRRASLLT
jgi:hypothetical protein